MLIHSDLDYDYNVKCILIHITNGLHKLGDTKGYLQVSFERPCPVVLHLSLNDHILVVMTVKSFRYEGGMLTEKFSHYRLLPCSLPCKGMVASSIDLPTCIFIVSSINETE